MLFFSREARCEATKLGLRDNALSCPDVQMSRALEGAKLVPPKVGLLPQEGLLIFASGERGWTLRFPFLVPSFRLISFQAFCSNPSTKGGFPKQAPFPLVALLLNKQRGKPSFKLA